MMKKKQQEKQKILKSKIKIIFVQSHLNLNNFINYLAFIPPQLILYQLVSFVYVCVEGGGVGFVCLEFLGGLL